MAGVCAMSCEGAAVLSSTGPGESLENGHEPTQRVLEKVILMRWQRCCCFFTSELVPSFLHILKVTTSHDPRDTPVKARSGLKLHGCRLLRFKLK